MCLHSLYTSFLDVPLVICKYGCTRKNWLKKPYISLTILHHNTIYMKNTMNHNWEWQSIYSNLPSTTQKKNFAWIYRAQRNSKAKLWFCKVNSQQYGIILLCTHCCHHMRIPPWALSVGSLIPVEKRWQPCNQHSD